MLLSLAYLIISVNLYHIELERIWQKDDTIDESLEETLKVHCNNTPLLFENRFQIQLSYHLCFAPVSQNNPKNNRR